MDTNMRFKPTKPKYLLLMETAYGPPSQNGFGSAVFFETIDSDEPLEKAALQRYKYFVGETWDRFGEDAWMSGWKQVYTRQKGANHDIVAELRGIEDWDVSQSIPMILDVVKDADFGKFALSKAFDATNVTELMVFNLGDGGAMSGVLIASRRHNNEATFLVFLMD